MRGFFFFSSRRRHTRLQGDWSSDVCSSDLRLVRVVCEHCKKMTRPTPEEMKASALDPALWSQIPLASGAGCLECAGSGYHGRAAISELLDLTDTIREMIINRRPTSEIKRAARDSGMTFLRDAGLAKVRAGVTTLKEINKVTFIE